MSNYIIIDGTEYQVPILELQRKGDILDLTARRREDGVLERDVIGTYYNYTVSIGYTRDRTVYDRLWQTLTAPVPSHMIQMTGQTQAFEGYFGSCKDNVFLINEEGQLTKGLSFNIVCTNPSITADPRE